MQAELFNIYIDKLLNEVSELTKTKLLLLAQLQHQQKISAELSTKVEELEVALDKAKSKKKSDSDL